MPVQAWGRALGSGSEPAQVPEVPAQASASDSEWAQGSAVRAQAAQVPALGLVWAPVLVWAVPERVLVKSEEAVSARSAAAVLPARDQP